MRRAVLCSIISLRLSWQMISLNNTIFPFSGGALIATPKWQRKFLKAKVMAHEGILMWLSREGSDFSRMKASCCGMAQINVLVCRIAHKEIRRACFYVQSNISSDHRKNIFGEIWMKTSEAIKKDIPIETDRTRKFLIVYEYFNAAWRAVKCCYQAIKLLRQWHWKLRPASPWLWCSSLNIRRGVRTKRLSTKKTTDYAIKSSAKAWYWVVHFTKPSARHDSAESISQ